MKKALLSLLSLASVAVLSAAGCSTRDPSEGSYTVTFPSTAAAVATDFVQLLIFDVTDANRASICLDKVTARLSDPTSVTPVQTAAPANICEMNLGRKPITFRYGEQAVLAVAQRKDASGLLKDFLIGCTVMTIGDGNAPLPIPVHLVSINTPVPTTTCGSVTEFCGTPRTCQ